MLGRVSCLIERKFLKVLGKVPKVLGKVCRVLGRVPTLFMGEKKVLGRASKV